MRLASVVLVLLCVGCSDGARLAGQDTAAGGEGALPDTIGGPELAVLQAQLSEQRPLPFHDTAFRAPLFAGAAVCGGCHEGVQTDTDTTLDLFSDWQTSMMASSARDPYFLAKLASEVSRAPARADAITADCLRCHAPMASELLQAEGQAPTFSGEHDVLRASNTAFDAAMEGVSCTLCHQLLPPAAGTVAENGNFTLAEPTASGQRLAFGPRPEPAATLMQTQTGFVPVAGAHLQESSTCAACHDLRVSHSGPASAGFVEQATFREWQASTYAAPGAANQQCQDCHMPALNTPSTLATRGGGARYTDIAQHTFLGANTVMQRVLRDHRAALGVAAEVAAFDASIARNQAFMRRHSSVAVGGQWSAGVLQLRVAVEHSAGHKFPSGFPSRRLVLHVSVHDASDRLIFESGRIDADGLIAGVDDRADAQAFQPHHQRIDRPEQVQIYEAVMIDGEGRVTTSLNAARSFLKDNRLLPPGLSVAGAADDIAVAGGARDDADFIGGSDVVDYDVPALGAGPWRIEVELIYQPLSPAHLTPLLAETELGDVGRFREMIDTVVNPWEIVARDELSLLP